MYKKESCQWCSLQHLTPAVKATVVWTDSFNLGTEIIFVTALLSCDWKMFCQADFMCSCAWCMKTEIQGGRKKLVGGTSAASALIAGFFLKRFYQCPLEKGFCVEAAEQFIDQWSSTTSRWQKEKGTAVSTQPSYYRGNVLDHRELWNSPLKGCAEQMSMSAGC